jgi:hypothetical protein
MMMTIIFIDCFECCHHENHQRKRAVSGFDTKNQRGEKRVDFGLL